MSAVKLNSYIILRLSGTVERRQKKWHFSESLTYPGSHLTRVYCNLILTFFLRPTCYLYCLIIQIRSHHVSVSHVSSVNGTIRCGQRAAISWRDPNVLVCSLNISVECLSNLLNFELIPSSISKMSHKTWWCFPMWESFDDDIFLLRESLPIEDRLWWRYFTKGVSISKMFPKMKIPDVRIVWWRFFPMEELLYGMTLFLQERIAYDDDISY